MSGCRVLTVSLSRCWGERQSQRALAPDSLWRESGPGAEGPVERETMVSLAGDDQSSPLHGCTSRDVEIANGRIYRTTDPAQRRDLHPDPRPGMAAPI
jgi:hypothetical protein